MIFVGVETLLSTAPSPTEYVVYSVGLGIRIRKGTLVSFITISCLGINFKNRLVAFLCVSRLPLRKVFKAEILLSRP